MKKITATLCAALSLQPLNGFAEGPDAYEVMKKVDERYDGDTRSSTSKLILIDKRERQRVRELSMFDFEKEKVKKSLIFFRSPPDVEGTTYMSFDWQSPDKEDENWLYLPALQQIKRIAAADESGSFMGSDFSYADINGLELDDYSYTLESKSESVNGRDCWLIRSTPKSDEVIDATGYTNVKTWIRKDIFMRVKAIINVKKGQRVKYFAVSDLEEVDGIWTARTLQMVTTRKGKREHSSLLKIGNIQYNKGVDENLFNTDTMQRGL